uniref:ubiquitinyl hydrolase 1 n=1 Tax=Meleagris gallopavo TaxID=9103 RepID=A0A803XUS7_MELGA
MSSAGGHRGRPSALLPCRSVLDFDFEKLCSISLSHINVYACLVCGKYFQGRGLKSHAYIHSVQFSHHVFLNLHTLKFYCLPDNYEIIDSSLEDITYVLKPTFTAQQISNLDKQAKLSRAYDGTTYLPGIVGLNNIKANDYANAVLQALSNVPPLRNYFLEEDNYKNIKRPPGDIMFLLVQRFGELMRKLWNPRNFKAHVSPHEMLQAVVLCSKKNFQITKQGDGVDFLSWFLNALHSALGGTKKKKKSEWGPWPLSPLPWPLSPLPWPLSPQCCPRAPYVTPCAPLSALSHPLGHPSCLFVTPHVAPCAPLVTPHPSFLTSFALCGSPCHPVSLLSPFCHPCASLSPLVLLPVAPLSPLMPLCHPLCHSLHSSATYYAPLSPFLSPHVPFVTPLPPLCPTVTPLSLLCPFGRHLSATPCPLSLPCHPCAPCHLMSLPLSLPCSSSLSATPPCFLTPCHSLVTPSATPRAPVVTLLPLLYLMSSLCHPHVTSVPPPCPMSPLCHHSAPLSPFCHPSTLHHRMPLYHPSVSLLPPFSTPM